jgi:NAD(P)-dependent dehydrogenase (short-subunit alcohol dehydrogenase family)
MFGTANVALVSGVGSEMGRSIALGLAQGRVDAVLAARRAALKDNLRKWLQSASRQRPEA